MKPFRFVFLALLGAALSLTLSRSPRAAEGSPRAYRVGVLLPQSSTKDEAAFRGVKEGFALAGMKANFDVAKIEADPSVVHERVELWEKAGYDLIYAFGTRAAVAAQENATKVPIVFTAVSSPVGSGLVPSWSGSGGNFCGNSSWVEVSDVMGVFLSAVPDLARLGVILDEKNRVSIQQVGDAHRWFKDNPMKALNLIEQWIGSRNELHDAIEQLLKKGAQAIWVPTEDDVFGHVEDVTKVTDPEHVPVLSSSAEPAAKGAVVGVAVDYEALGRNSVVYAKKILVDHDRPSELPVGRMHAFRVIVNMRAAKRAGITLPLTLLATADEIVPRSISDVGAGGR